MLHIVHLNCCGFKSLITGADWRLSALNLKYIYSKKPLVLCQMYENKLYFALLSNLTNNPLDSLYESDFE